jgi:kynurenine 3-monooxygenase
VELRDTANQPAFLARKQLDLLLSRLFPSRWMPLYTMVVHTTMPYAEAMERQRKQELILRRLGVTALLSTVFPVAAAVRRLVRRRPAAPVRG